MKPLKLRDVYSRRDIHGIFSPDTKFTPQAGTWGLQGIVKIPSRESDFVFILPMVSLKVITTLMRV